MPRRPRAEFEITAKDRAGAVLRSIDGNLSRLTRTAQLGARALGGLGAGVGLSEVAQLSDRYNQLATRVRTATKETGDFESVLESLRNTSIETGSDLEGTVETFQALARVREDIGATNEQMIALTRIVQQLGVIGGTSTEALRNGLRQFNQAIAAGTFRAEEFNSIVENTPELARRIADGFGVTQGALREMVLDGRLFAEDVMETLLRQAPEIAAEFETIPTNLDRAFQSLETSIGTAFSELDQATGATEALARQIEEVAREIRNLTGTASAEDQLLIRLGEINDEIEALNRRIENFRDRGINATGSTLFDRTYERIRELRAEARELEAELVDVQGAAAEVPSTVSGGTDRTSDIQQGNTDRLRLQQKHFEDLLKQEQDYLDTQFQLELDGKRRTLELIAEEEDRFREDQLARALGFADEKALIEFEKDEELHQAKLEALYRRLEDELAVELGFEDRRAQELAEAEQRSQRQIFLARNRGNNLVNRAVIAQRKFEEAQGANKIAVLAGQGATLLNSFGQQSQKRFDIAKKLALAEAVINTATGVTKALASYDFVGAALIAALGAAQIATIQSTEYQGGGSAGSFSGGSAGGGGPAEAPIREIPVFDTEERSTQRIELTIRGEGEVTDALARGLEASVEEGDIVLIPDGSRQAQDLDGRL